MKQAEFTKHTGKPLLLIFQKPLHQGHSHPRGSLGRERSSTAESHHLNKAFPNFSTHKYFLLFFSSVSFVDIHFYLYIQPNNNALPLTKMASFSLLIKIGVFQGL